jgi:hypothetical protein
MKVQLRHRELQNAAQGDLVFTDGEAVRIRQTLAETRASPPAWRNLEATGSVGEGRG